MGPPSPGEDADGRPGPTGTHWDTKTLVSPPLYDTYQKRDLGQAQEGEAAPHRSTFQRPDGKSMPQRALVTTAAPRVCPQRAL